MASLLLGGVVGLISVTIFAVILRRLEQSNPNEAIDHLKKLIYLVGGAGLADYFAFDFILQSGAIVDYLFGLCGTFMPLGSLIFLDWYRGAKRER